VFQSLAEAVDFIYQSYNRAAPYIHPAAKDEVIRLPQLTAQLLDGAGNPQKGRKILLVTGSKGKGSVSRMIASILHQAGLKVGHFTSPHLVNFRERIRVNGRAIPEAELLKIMDQLRPLAEELTSRLEPPHYLGPVGITLAAALFWFQDQNCDFEVVEVGRGGFYDDTAVLANHWAVITPIFKEHVPRLGPELTDIARNKSGVIKEGGIALSAGQRPEVAAVLQERAQQAGAQYLPYGQSFEAVNCALTPKGATITLRLNSRLVTASLPFLAGYQAENAALAAAAAQSVIPGLEPDTIARGLENARWPGRAEIIARKPLVLVDGAIAAPAAAHLKESINSLGVRPVVLVTAIPADKDYAGCLAQLAPLAQKVVVTESVGAQFPFPADAAEEARRYCADVQQLSPSAAAFRQALEVPGIENGLVVVAGTQSLVGEALAFWRRDILDLDE